MSGQGPGYSPPGELPRGSHQSRGPNESGRYYDDINVHRDGESQHAPSMNPRDSQFSKADNNALVDNYKSDNIGFDSGSEHVEEGSIEKQDVLPGDQPSVQPKGRKNATLKNRNDAVKGKNKNQKSHELWDQSSIEMKQSHEPSKMFIENSRIDKDRMYEELYHKVMKVKDPKDRLSNNQYNTFDAYKDTWNRIQDRNDRDYQRKLYEINKSTYHRMDDELKKQDLKKQQMAIHLKNEMSRKEMEECTFSPRIDVSHTSKKLREKVGDRSGKSQTRAQEMFMAKKEQWLEQQRREQEARDRSMQKNFISKGSERIMRDKSRTMDKGENSFL